MQTLTRTLATLATLALSAAALHAQAAVLVYTTEADYLAAVGTTRAYIDFAGSPGTNVGGGSFSPAVTFGSCTDSAVPGTCGTTVLHNSNAITDLGGSAAANGVASLAWRFNETDVFAFAFHYVSGDIDAVALVEAGTLGTQLIDTTAANGFIGLVSDSAFYGGIGVNAVFAGGVGNDRYFIDDFRISAAGATTVAEPGVLGLAGLALMAAGAARRRPGRDTTKSNH
jgi:hypothetical protein